MAPIDSLQAGLPQTFSFFFFLMQNLSAVKGGTSDDVHFVLLDFHHGLFARFSGNPRMQTLKHTPGLSPPSWLHAQPGHRWVSGEVWEGFPALRGAQETFPGCWEAAPGCRAGTCPSPSGKLSAAATEAGTREPQTRG